MDYKSIEPTSSANFDIQVKELLERYFNAETSLEEESFLRSFFSQEHIPAELEHWRQLFTTEPDEKLSDDFDARILALTVGNTSATSNTETVKARSISLTHRLMPLFKAAAVVAIILTIGGALQAPWDSSWNNPEVDEYASYQQELDSVAVDSPIQAENATPTTPNQ